MCKSLRFGWRASSWGTAKTCSVVLALGVLDEVRGSRLKTGMKYSKGLVRHCEKAHYTAISSLWPDRVKSLLKNALTLPDSRLHGELAEFQQAAALAEGREITRDINVYSRDVWNFLDITVLLVVFGGFLVRVFDASSPWGRGLYALGTPLLFFRVLYFAEMLRFQGPIVQASVDRYLMTPEAKYGVL